MVTCRVAWYFALGRIAAELAFMVKMLPNRKAAEVADVALRLSEHGFLMMIPSGI